LLYEVSQIMYKLNIKLCKNKNKCYNTKKSNPTPLAIVYMSQC